jgi:electron transfer flavoprotein beta subunit
VIRKALAIGADDAIRIDVTGNADSYAIASEIAAVTKTGGYDMILLGKETISYNGSILGGMLAELLDLPFVSYASKLDMSGNTATIEREIEGGKEIIEVATPFVVSCAKGMAEARIPNMKGIMSAKTKPLQVVTPQGTAALSSVVKYELPPAKSAVRMIAADHPEELVELLHNEAKVI